MEYGDRIRRKSSLLLKAFIFGSRFEQNEQFKLVSHSLTTRAQSI